MELKSLLISLSVFSLYFYFCATWPPQLHSACPTITYHIVIYGARHVCMFLTCSSGYKKWKGRKWKYNAEATSTIRKFHTVVHNTTINSLL